MKLKLKQKKLIVIASLVVIGIGTLVFSLVNAPDNKELVSKDIEETQELSQLEAESQIASFTGKSGNQGEEDTAKEAETEPVLELQVDAEPKTVELITAYMNAKLEPSTEAFTPLVNDVSLLDIEAMERETNIIEKYDNIKVYSIDTPKEGISLIYVYHEVKFIGIETAAPAATRFLVVQEADKAPYIFNGELSEETKTFISEFEQSEAYDNLVEDVNAKLLEALAKDEVLSEFYERLYDSNAQAQAETEASGETSESQETQAQESSEAAQSTESSETTETSEGTSN